MKYNENILTLDQRYKTLIPRFDVLIRAYVKPLVKDGDILLPAILPVNVKTDNGRGMLYQTDNPYPFSNKAVVISPCGVATDLKPGQIVVIDPGYRLVEAVGNGDNAYIKVNGFIHPENAADYTEYPTNPEDTNYGYFLVRNDLIKLIVQ